MTSPFRMSEQQLKTQHMPVIQKLHHNRKDYQTFRCIVEQANSLAFYRRYSIDHKLLFVLIVSLTGSLFLKN